MKAMCIKTNRMPSCMVAGFALVPALVAIGMMSVLSLSLSGLVAQFQTRYAQQQADSLLAVQTQELFELAIYQLKASDGIPEGLSTTIDDNIRPLADACQNRAENAHPEIFETQSLDDASFSFSLPVTRTANRRQSSFFSSLSAPPGFRRYAVLACTILYDELLDSAIQTQLILAEITETQGSWQVLFIKHL